MISEELKLWRKQNNYSQGRLARALEVDVMTISRWERGLRNIPSFLALALKSLESNKEKTKEYTEIEKRIRRYSSMMRTNPKEVKLYIDRAALYAYIGSYKAAFDDLNRAIQIEPADAKIYLERGILYSRYARKYEKAVVDFTHAITLDPLLERAYSYRGRAYLKLGKHQQAIEDFDSALKINPRNSRLYFYRGTAYEKLENYERALKDFMQARESVFSFYFEKDVNEKIKKYKKMTKEKKVGVPSK